MINELRSRAEELAVMCAVCAHARRSAELAFESVGYEAKRAVDLPTNVPPRALLAFKRLSLATEAYNNALVELREVNQQIKDLNA